MEEQFGGFSIMGIRRYCQQRVILVIFLGGLGTLTAPAQQPEAAAVISNT